MAERRQCEFHLVRYVPDPVRDEFVNIGVLLRESGGGGTVRFTRDWARVRCADPDADLAMLEGLEGEVRLRLAGRAAGVPAAAEREVPALMTVLEESFSNAVQITAAKGYLAESTAAGIDELMQLYVEPRRRPSAARRGGRQAIHGRMRAQFERAGVWDLMRKRIAAAGYTRPGDPLRIDCGYRPNGVVRMFHAVSLEGDLETAKVLAFSVAALREGVRRIEGATLELTAIVEPLLDIREAAGREHAGPEHAGPEHGVPEYGDRGVQYRFAIETMEQHAIRVLTTADLPRIAEAARLDLRL